MKKFLSKLMLFFLAGAIFLAVGITTASALDFGDVAKVFGIAYLVDQYDKDINEFVNRALGERDAQAKGATRVVPILSVGSGGYVGAAQVVGIPSGVERTKAVLEIEIKAGSFRAIGMLPIGKKTADPNATRINGVGVSAVVDFKI